MSPSPLHHHRRRALQENGGSGTLPYAQYDTFLCLPFIRKRTQLSNRLWWWLFNCLRLLAAGTSLKTNEQDRIAEKQ